MTHVFVSSCYQRNVHKKLAYGTNRIGTIILTIFLAFVGLFQEKMDKRSQFMELIKPENDL